MSYKSCNIYFILSKYMIADPNAKAVRAKLF